MELSIKIYIRFLQWAGGKCACYLNNWYRYWNRRKNILQEYKEDVLYCRVPLDEDSRRAPPGCSGLCEISYPAVWAGHSLTAERKWWNVTSEIRLQRDSGFHLAHHLLSSLAFSVACSEQSPAMSSCPWTGPRGEKLITLANRQPGSDACRQPREWAWKWVFWGLPAATWVSLEASAPPVKLTAILLETEPEDSQLSRVLRLNSSLS